MQKLYNLSLISALSGLLCAHQQPKLIDQILEPLRQPQEINKIIQEYLGPEYIQVQLLKANRTLRSRLIAFVYNCLNHDGSLFAQKQFNGTIEMWDVITGNKIKSVPAKFDSTIALTFSPNNTQLLEILEPHVRYIDLTTDGTINIPLADNIAYKIYALGKKHIASSGRNNRTVSLFDLDSKRSTLLDRDFGFENSPGEAVSLAFNSDDTLLAIATSEDNVIIWNTKTNTGHTYFPQPLTGRIGRLAFSPDSKWLAVTCQKLIEIYDIDSKKCIFSMPLEEIAQTDSVSSIVFSADKRHLIIITEQGIIKINLCRRELTPLIPSNTQKDFITYALSADQRYIAAGTNDIIKIYADLNTRMPYPTTQKKQNLAVERTTVRDRVLVLTTMLCTFLYLDMLYAEGNPKYDLDAGVINATSMASKAACVYAAQLTKREKAFVAGLYLLMLYWTQCMRAVSTLK